MANATGKETEKLEKEIEFLTSLINNHKKSSVFSTGQSTQRPRFHQSATSATRNNFSRSSTYNPHSLRNKTIVTHRSNSVSGNFPSSVGHSRFKYVSGQKREEAKKTELPNAIPTKSKMGTSVKGANYITANPLTKWKTKSPKVTKTDHLNLDLERNKLPKSAESLKSTFPVSASTSKAVGMKPSVLTSASTSKAVGMKPTVLTSASTSKAVGMKPTVLTSASTNKAVGKKPTVLTSASTIKAVGKKPTVLTSSASTSKAVGMKFTVPAFTSASRVTDTNSVTLVEKEKVKRPCFQTSPNRKLVKNRPVQTESFNPIVSKETYPNLKSVTDNPRLKEKSSTSNSHFTVNSNMVVSDSEIHPLACSLKGTEKGTMFKSSTFPVYKVKQGRTSPNRFINTSPVKLGAGQIHDGHKVNKSQYTWTSQQQENSQSMSFSNGLKKSTVHTTCTKSLPKSSMVHANSSKNLTLQRLTRKSSRSANEHDLFSQKKIVSTGNSRYRFVRQKSSDIGHSASVAVIKSNSQTQTAARIISSKYKLHKLLPQAAVIHTHTSSTGKKGFYRKASNANSSFKSRTQNFSLDNRKGPQNKKYTERRVQQRSKMNTHLSHCSKYKLERNNHGKSTLYRTGSRNKSRSTERKTFPSTSDSHVLSIMLTNRGKHKFWTNRYSLKRNSEHAISINQILGRHVRNLSKNKYKFLTSKSVKTLLPHKAPQSRGDQPAAAFPSRSKLKLDRRDAPSPKKGGDGGGEKSLRLVVIGGMLYRSTATSLNKSKCPSKQKLHTKSGSPSVLIKHTDLGRGRMKTVTVHGIRYEVDKSGKSLKRVQNPNVKGPSELVKAKTKSRIDIGGETFVQTKPGTLVRISNRNKRLLASSALSRSIARATKKKKVPTATLR